MFNHTWTDVLHQPDDFHNFDDKLYDAFVATERKVNLPTIDIYHDTGVYIITDNIILASESRTCETYHRGCHRCGLHHNTPWSTIKNARSPCVYEDSEIVCHLTRISAQLSYLSKWAHWYNHRCHLPAAWRVLAMLIMTGSIEQFILPHYMTQRIRSSCRAHLSVYLG